MARKKTAKKTTKKKAAKKKAAKKASAKKTTKKKAAKKPAKKKPAKKKAAKRDEKPPESADVDLDDLEREIEEDLAKEFDFEDPRTGIGAPTDDWIGKTVEFQDSGATIRGIVRKQQGIQLVIEDESAYWKADVADVEIVPDPGSGPETEGKTTDDLLDEFLGDDEVPSTEPEPKPAEKPKAAEKPKGKEKGKPAAEEHESEDVRWIPVDSIKVSPKNLPRGIDPENDPDYGRIKADMKKRRQRDAIKVDSFAKPTLVDGLCRLTIARELGWKTIKAIEDGSEDAEDRLYNGLLDNEMRRQMHWLDVTDSVVRLTKGGKYKQGSLCKAIGQSPSEVSRAIAAVSMMRKEKSGELMKLARDNAASRSVFTRLPGAPQQVVDEVKQALSKGKLVTKADVMARIKEVEKASRTPSSEPEPETPGTGRAPTYQDLPRTDLGDHVRVRVYPDRVQFTLEVEWTNKTFRNFDVLKQTKGVWDEAFGDEGTALSSWKALEKALTATKAELIP